MAEGGLDSGFLDVEGMTTSKKRKKKNKTKDEISNENESLQQEERQTIEMIPSHNIENGDRKKMEEKDSELPFVQSNKIARLENEIQELKARITTSEKNEYEMKKQLINAEKGNKNGSEYDQSGIVKHRKEIDELKNTIVEKDKELQKAKEINLNQSVQFEKLTKEIAIIKDDITRKHDENMEARETNERKQDQRLEELLEQVKITQSMLSDILKQNSKKVQGQNQGIGSQQNKPKTSKSSVQSQPSKSEQKIETEV